MSNYFDKDFFKFLLGFVAIIAISLVIILGTEFYQNKSGQEASTLKTTQKN